MLLYQDVVTFSSEQRSEITWGCEKERDGDGFAVSLSVSCLSDVLDNIFILSLKQDIALKDLTHSIKLLCGSSRLKQLKCIQMPRVLYSVWLSYIHQWWSYHGNGGEHIYFLHRSVSLTALWSSISILPTCLTSGGNLVMMSLFRAYQDQLVYNTRTRAHRRRQTHINTHTYTHTHTIIKK